MSRPLEAMSVAMRKSASGVRADLGQCEAAASGCQYYIYLYTYIYIYMYICIDMCLCMLDVLGVCV